MTDRRDDILRGVTNEVEYNDWTFHMSDAGAVDEEAVVDLVMRHVDPLLKEVAKEQALVETLERTAGGLQELGEALEKRAMEAEQELRQRELHHFETEQENARLRESLSRWEERCVEAQRERDALRDGRTPDQHLRDQIRHLEAHVAELQEQVHSLEVGADEY